jgi:two-component system, NtrC family, sensor kinase
MLVIDVGPILSEPSDPQRLGKTGEVLVGVRDRDRTRFLIPPRLTPGEIEFPASRTPAMNRAVAGERGFMWTQDRLGREVLAAFRPVRYEAWGLVAKMDVAEAYAPVNRLRRLLLAIGGLILTLGLAASYLIARQNTRPIRKLAATADPIARGQLADRIDVNSSDEIGTLGLALSRMTEEHARTPISSSVSSSSPETWKPCATCSTRSSGSSLPGSIPRTSNGPSIRCCGSVINLVMTWR